MVPRACVVAQDAVLAGKTGGASHQRVGDGPSLMVMVMMEQVSPLLLLSGEATAVKGGRPAFFKVKLYACTRHVVVGHDDASVPFIHCAV